MVIPFSVENGIDGLDHAVFENILADFTSLSFLSILGYRPTLIITLSRIYLKSSPRILKKYGVFSCRASYSEKYFIWD